MSPPSAESGSTGTQASHLDDAVLEALPTQIAVLDGDGVIVRTNEAWRRFGRDNGIEMPPDTLGVNYLDVCRVSPDEDGDAAAAGIERVLAGESDEFAYEYPCHSPNEERWFLMRALPLGRGDGGEVVVMHLDITERKLAEIEVRKRAAEIDRQSDQIEVLNWVLRHDIRNDVYVVRSAAELLREGVGTDRETDPLEQIIDVCEHVFQLTTTAKELSETVTETDSVSLHPVDVGAVLRSELDHADGAHDGATFTVDGDLPAVDVTANDMLSSVFGNLFNNAVSHNHTGAPEIAVDATVDHDADEVIVRIRDNGPGVPDDQKETMFEKDVKGLKSSGTGLGLYLVTTLVDGYGGDIGVSDNDPKGAVFTVRLPLAP